MCSSTCSVPCAACSVHCAACSVHHAACSVHRAACSVHCASLSVVHVQGTCRPGGRVQVRVPVLRPVRLRRVVRQPAQEARRGKLPQGLEGGGEGETQ